jgi:hypothetical protein
MVRNFSDFGRKFVEIGSFYKAKYSWVAYSLLRLYTLSIFSVQAKILLAYPETTLYN